MSEFTENYNFIKPSEEDYYDVQDFNENMDAIDTQLMKTEREINGIGEKMEEMDGKLGTAADTGTDTIFGRLHELTGTGGGVRVVKSIQHLVIELFPPLTKNVEEEIQEVDPSRCIVIWQRMQDRNQMEGKVTYTLNPTKFIAILDQNTSIPVVIDIYIVEFY